MSFVEEANSRYSGASRLTKICEICGKEFRLPIGGKICRYCSSHCLKCGKKLGVWEGDRAKTRNHLCDQCHEYEQLQKLKEKKFQGHSKVKICEACGKKIEFLIGSTGSNLCRNCISHCPICGKKKGLTKERARSIARKGLCDECFEKERKKRLKNDKLTMTNPSAGFSPKDLISLKNALKEVERITCLECVFCQPREQMVEKASVTNLFGAIAGAPIEYETRIHLVCRKFLLDLNDKLDSAEECSSFLTEQEYHKKAIKGEIVGFAGVERNEIAPSNVPMIATCQYCNSQYDISLYRKCPKCGAYSPKLNSKIKNEKSY